MRPDEDLLDFIDRRRRAIRDLPGWRSGPERLLILLQRATRLRAMEVARGLNTDVPWESVLANIIAWHHEIPLGEGACGAADAMDICVAALEATRLDNIYGTARAGAYEVRRRGSSFRVRHRWNPALEAADAFLERAATPTDLPEVTEVERRWISERSQASRKLPPPDVLDAAVQRAGAAINAYRQALPEGHLPDSFELDSGLTVGDAVAVLTVLMGFASLCEAAAHMLKRTETTLASLRRATLLKMVSELLPAVPPARIDTIIERLTFAPGRSCRISPLVQIQETIIVCPPLMTPRAVDAIVLRSAAYEPGRYGPIGQRQGGRAAKWASWLRDVPAVLVAERIRVRRQDGTAAGDLDVIAVDPQQRRGVCFEIKWPIDPISLPEVTKIEDWMCSAAAQVDRVRSELLSGTATVKMPDGWPAFSDVKWTWAVATPQQLCLRPPPFDEVYATSFRYMASHGDAGSIDDVINTITAPDLPINGVHFQTGTIDLTFGPQKVVLDVLHLVLDGWRPRLWHC